ncbi:MAG: PAS domain S-box protein [Nitrospirae bacterium]|nr:PAS domain S-box protein [Nitrospirota bacterium]
MKSTTVLILKNLRAFLSERLYPFNVRAVLVLVGVIILPLLLLGVLILAWMSYVKVKDVATANFNQQQLVLAQNAAAQIENRINILRRELSLLSLSPSVQYHEATFMGKRMDIAFSSVKDEGVIEIRYVENEKMTHIMNRTGYLGNDTYSDDLSHLGWAQDEKNKGAVLIKDVSKIPPLVEKGGAVSLVMKMVLPVWQVSVDDTHPVAGNMFSGVMIFVIDATTLVKEIIKDIRSGETGYAWAIDENGTFLFHPEREFIGKNAFEARKEKKPTISFAKINEIQKEMMLMGKEGTSWYVSGWHRGMEGEIKKLIAYSPIHLSSESGSLVWSVAVVAPVSEVEGAIHGVQIRHLLVEGGIILVIFWGGVLIIGIVLFWSTTLNEEVKRKTNELRESENRYRLLIENANDIIFAVTPDGDILSMNKAGSIFFNCDQADFFGKNIGEICHNENSASLQFRAIDQVIKTGESQQVEYSVVINDNEYWLSTNFSGIQDEKGNISAVLGIARDITRRKKMEEQMYHTEKLASIGTLAAGVAHEINNPLTIILGFTDMLKEKGPGYSEYQDILNTIEKQGLNAKRVVENLLTFARYKEHHEENVDINKNILEVLSILGNTSSLNKITIQKDLSVLLPFVNGEPGELQQVFLNIANNAIAAMKGGGTLKILTKLSEDDNNVEIMLSDTGCGIKKEHRSKIFDPLFTTKSVGEGTGLGLSVSYGIVAKHGGAITFETKTEEESSEHGTTFIITLPAIKQ